MKKLLSLALAIAMIACLSTTAFAAEANAPGSNTAEVTGSYVAGNESNGIVYCVDIEWDDLSFTYHAEKGAVWNPETLTYSAVEPAYWEGTGAITVTNRSNTKIAATPTYAAKDGFESAGMTFDADKLKIASAEIGTAQIGTITVTPNGFLPAMAESATIGTITLTIVQDTDVTLDEADALIDKVESLINHAKDVDVYESNKEQFQSLDNAKMALATEVVTIRQAGSATPTQQNWLNSAYQEALSLYNECKTIVGL